MNTLLFIYNLLLTVVFAGLMSGYYFLNHNKKDKVNTLIVLLLGVLVIDHGLIYFSEFALNQMSLSSSHTLILYIMDVLYFAFVFVIRLIYSKIYDAPLTQLEKGAFACIPLTLIAVGQVIEVSYYDVLVTTVLYLSVLYVAAKYYVKNPNERVMAGLVVFACAVGILDACVLSFGLDFQYPAFIEQLVIRDIAFDLIKLVVCFVCARYLIQQYKNLSYTHQRKIHSEDLNEVSGEKIEGNVKHNTLQTESVSNTFSSEDKLLMFSEKFGLTQRQKEIVKCIMDGKTNKEISAKLFITEGTVKTHIYNVFKKTDVTNRSQLVSMVLSDETITNKN